MKRLLLMLGLVLSAPVLAAVEGSLLLYRVHEPGTEPYPSRIIVTTEQVRMDDGVDDGDFLLFDRKARIIRSITHGDQTIFEIHARPVDMEPPLTIERDVEEVKGEAMPSVAGRQPRYRRLNVNGERCYDLVSAEGLLLDVVEALSEYRRVLAGEHANTLRNTPADMQDACDMALHTFYPDWQLRFGLPIQEWDKWGRGQVLMDFREHLQWDEQLFVLPAGYRRYSTAD